MVLMTPKRHILCNLNPISIKWNLCSLFAQEFYLPLFNPREVCPLNASVYRKHLEFLSIFYLVLVFQLALPLSLLSSFGSYHHHRHHPFSFYLTRISILLFPSLWILLLKGENISMFLCVREICESMWLEYAHGESAKFIKEILYFNT